MLRYCMAGYLKISLQLIVPIYKGTWLLIFNYNTNFLLQEHFRIQSFDSQFGFCCRFCWLYNLHVIVILYHEDLKRFLDALLCVSWSSYAWYSDIGILLLDIVIALQRPTYHIWRPIHDIWSTSTSTSPSPLSHLPPWLSWSYFNMMFTVLCSCTVFSDFSEVDRKLEFCNHRALDFWRDAGVAWSVFANFRCDIKLLYVMKVFLANCSTCEKAAVGLVGKAQL